MRPRSWRIRVGLPVLALWLGASAGRSQAASNPPRLSPDDLRARIDSIRTAVEAPSAQVAVLTPDTTILWNFGVVDPESGRPVTDATMFRLGSVGKSFAGITMLTLVEQGLVDLDDELRVLAPELPVRNPWRVDRPVRLSHLLEAGAGFVGFQDADYEPPDSPRIPIRRVIEKLPYRLDVQWPPGEYTAYHNIGPTLTAYLVEKLTGERYEDVVRKQVFRSLGMEHSTFFRTETWWTGGSRRPG